MAGAGGEKDAEPVHVVDGPSSAAISHSSEPSEPASTWRTWTDLPRARTRRASSARASATAASFSSVEGRRGEPGYGGPPRRGGEAERCPGASSTHRPHRMHLPWSSSGVAAPLAEMAPVGHLAAIAAAGVPG